METARKSLPETPGQGRIVVLFKHCMEFSLHSMRFQEKTEELRRVGINAQIQAAHSVAGSEVLGVLVSEIGRLSISINAILEELSKSGVELARMALVTTVMGNQLKHYKSAWDLGLGPGTDTILSQHYLKSFRTMSDNFRNIEARFGQHRHALEELREATVFIPALISLLNINVVQYQESAGEFAYTASELEAFREFILHSCRFMLSGLEESMSLLAEIRNGSHSHD